MGSETVTIQDVEAIIGSPMKGKVMYRVNMLTQAVPKGRARMSRSGHMYTPERTRQFEALVREMVSIDFEERSFIECPLEVHVIITSKVPKSYSKLKHTLGYLGLIHPKRGDTDNLVKAITDAMNGVAYKDDAQIKSIVASQSYGYDEKITVILYRVGLSEEEVQQVHAFVTERGGNVNANRRGTGMGE